MSTNAWIQIGIFFALLLLAVKPLGTYMAAVYQGKFSRFDGWIYRILGVNPLQEQSWQQYASHWLWLHALGFSAVLGILMTQQWHPWNPQGLAPLPFHTAFNIASSFATNTNWQNSLVSGYFLEKTCKSFQVNNIPGIPPGTI